MNRPDLARGLSLAILLGGCVAGPNRISLRHTAFHNVALSPDGMLLASPAAGSFQVRLLKVPGGEPVRDLAVANARDQISNAVAFSPDGALLASADSDRLRIFRIADGRELLSFPAYPDNNYGVAFSPAGGVLATYSIRIPAPVRLWRVADGRPMRELGGEERVGAVAFSRDGSLLATRDASRPTVRVFRVEDGKLLRTVPRRSEERGSLAFSPDATLLAIADGKWTRLLRVEDGVLLRDLSMPEPWIQMRAVAFSADGTRIAIGCSDNTVAVFDREGVIQGVIAGTCGSIAWVAFRRDGSLLASGTSDDRGSRYVDLQPRVCFWPASALEGLTYP
jgi:WD40 repeat protein